MGISGFWIFSMVRQVKKPLKIGVIMDFFKDALKDAVDIANRIVIAVNKFSSPRKETV